MPTLHRKQFNAMIRVRETMSRLDGVPVYWYFVGDAFSTQNRGTARRKANRSMLREFKAAHKESKKASERIRAMKSRVLSAQELSRLVEINSIRSKILKGDYSSLKV